MILLEKEVRDAVKAKKQIRNPIKPTFMHAAKSKGDNLGRSLDTEG